MPPARGQQTRGDEVPARGGSSSFYQPPQPQRGMHAYAPEEHSMSRLDNLPEGAAAPYDPVRDNPAYNIPPSRRSPERVYTYTPPRRTPTSPPMSAASTPRMNSGLSRTTDVEKDNWDYGGFPNAYGSSRALEPTLHPHGTRNTNILSGGVASSSTPYQRYQKKRTCIPESRTNRRLLFWGVPIAIAVIAGAVIGGVLGSRKKSSGSGAGSSSESGSGSSDGGSESLDRGSGSSDGGTSQTTWNSFIQPGSGADGSVVTTDLGVNFTYTNSFGGSWAQDPYNPYSVSGKAQSYTPSLLEEWVWGQDIARGVNLGGWLVTEPFIVPALYERYQNSTPKAIDEYTLSQAMGDNLAAEMEEHYKTFITEEDFAQIAAAGLNYVRIPLGYWAVETIDGEPYLPKVSWTYFLKAIDWCRKYGLRILLDFHGLPGSQNGWNHSGKGGAVNWMYGVMGLANGERSLETLRSLVQYISQDGVKQVIPMIGLVNEVQATVVGTDVLSAFYYQAYKMIRETTGYGAGNGPLILAHEGFVVNGVAAWNGFLKGADRFGLDQHPYLAFQSPQLPDNHTVQAKTVCGWGGGTNDTSTAYGVIMGGEWSNAINDCGRWLNGVDSTPQYEVTNTGSCTQWDEYFNFSEATKQSIMEYTMASMDALQNFFFWTWKIGNSTEMGYPTSPMWHYKLGLEQGWMPKDPRAAGGICKSIIGEGSGQFAGTYPASAVGSFAAGSTPTIDADQLASHSVWPPTVLGPSSTFSAAQISLFPTLTQTGTPNVLPTPTHPANVTLGGGWAFAADTTGAWVRVAGCDYPDAYNATAYSNLPAAVCTGSSGGASTTQKRDLGVRVLPTTPPS